MNKKFLLSICLLSGSLALSSCSLFNDSDILEPNIYNPQYDEEETVAPGTTVIDLPSGEVAEKDAPAEAGVGTKVFKNICYGTYNEDTDTYTIPNTYKVGGSHHMGYNVNGGEDYPNANQLHNNYDLYVPSESVTPRDQKHVVILFIHGGAWVSGVKTDVNPYIHEFANRGYITATIKYTLLRREMDDPSRSIFRNLDEIDACIKSIKKVLGELGFDTSKSQLVIGGASSGAHLSMLYSYSRGKESPIPIKFVVDAVGPVNIKEDCWKAFTSASESVLDAGLDKTAIAAQSSNLSPLAIAGEGKNWTDYQTFRIANGMCGMPYTIEQVKAATDTDENYVVHSEVESYQNMIAEGGGEDQLSVTYWINKADEASKFPIICAYAGLDSIVGIKQYATLQTALDAKGITSYTAESGKNYIYFRYSGHELELENTDPHYSDYVNRYNELINAVATWADAA